VGVFRTIFVDMQMTGHKTRSVFERYNIVSACDLVEAAKKLNAIQPTVRPKPDTATDNFPADSDRHGHNLGTVTLALSFSSRTGPDEDRILPEASRQVREVRRCRPANLGLGHRSEML
jgi:hypothetical protein